MSKVPAVTTSSPVPALTISAASRARLQTALDDVLAPSTRRAYERHWRTFESYLSLIHI